MSETTVEIIGTDGKVHYRRPPGHPDIDRALATPGYTTREVTNAEKPTPPAKPAITMAQVRAVMKGKRPGGVKMSGAFGKDKIEKAHNNPEHPDFDRKAVIERCVKAGWMFYGEGFGTYVTTEAGVAAVAAFSRWQDARDDYKQDLKAWRIQQRRANKMQKEQARAA
jgi:hypothetical protein